MKKTILTMLTLALVATSCHKPEYVKPTADRQGLTSLTAIFTFGPFVDQELAKLTIEDDSQDYFVIPIPYYFPASSENQTLAYMTSVRVQAELQPNFKLDPPLGVLDLTDEHKFTLTDPFGNSRQIIITGQRVKSADCEVLSFSLDNPKVSGVIDKTAKTIVLPTGDDVSHCTATISVSPHATVSPDLSKPRDYTNPVKITVTAHDGKTTAEYTVQTGAPEKMESGININSIEKLFNLDPVTRMGLPPYNESVYISLASIEGNLIVCLGNGSAPVYFDGISGDRKGFVNLGSAPADVIANDEGGHLLFASYAQGGDNRETVNIWKTSSVSDAPVLFHSFDNPIDVPIGHRMKIMGDVEKNAVITFTAEGIESVTSTAKAVYLTVKGGAVTSVDVVDFASVTGGWGPAPVHIGTVVPASVEPGLDGWFYDYYNGNADAEGNYLLHYCTAAGADNIVARLGNGNYNPNCLDSKGFNNCRYMVLLIVSHFPQWVGPMLYMFDITDPASTALLVSNENLAWTQKGTNGVAAGDVILSPSADGYKLYMYFYDHNSQAAGGYVVDCIKR